MHLLALALPVVAAATGAWTEQKLYHEGATRIYHVYVPSGNLQGLMLFLHGSGMTNSFPDGGHIAPWQVATNADQYGFIGVVPVGSPLGNGFFAWNVDNAACTNEVSFVHAAVQAVTQAHALPANAHKIALGFSNGAAMANLLGCHRSPNLWVAHVATHYIANSDFPSSCSRESSSCAEWNAIGDADFFISSLGPTPAEGIRNQFSTLHGTLGCPAESWTATTGSGYSCYEYPNCTALGQLCVYANTGHDIKPSMTGNAWTYLTGASGSAGWPSCATATPGGGVASGNGASGKGTANTGCGSGGTGSGDKNTNDKSSGDKTTTGKDSGSSGAANTAATRGKILSLSGLLVALVPSALIAAQLTEGA